MKLKPGFVLREILEEWMVMPVGEPSTRFPYMISLNETGAGLWKQLQVDTTEPALVEWLTGEYDVTREVAQADVARFLADARAKGVLDE